MPRPSAELGAIIRRQRELNRLTLRQFASMAGISNPYLSQIERGLRAPSGAVVDAIARSLGVSPQALYEQAGLAPEDEVAAAVEDALRADARLTARQRRVVLDVYEAMLAAGPGPARRGVT